MASGSGQFTKVLKAVGLEPVGSLLDSGGAEIWQVSAPNAFGGTKHHVLHLGADASWQASEALTSKALTRGSELVVAIAEESCRLLADKPRIQRQFGVTEVLTRREFLARAFKAGRGGTGSPVGEREDLGPFVEPSILMKPGRPDERSLGFHDLVNWLSGAGPSTQSPALGVLVADAGIGKTTVARHIRQRLLKAQTKTLVPLLIESKHWKKLGDTDLDLWDIWRQSLDVESLPIQNEAAFDIYVGYGILIPILDGFDELCSLRSRHFKPTETVKHLQKLCSPKKVSADCS